MNNNEQVSKKISIALENRDRQEKLNKKLLKAVENCNANEMNILIARGASVRMKYNDDGDKLIFRTMYKSQYEMAKVLIRNGADVNVKNEEGCSPLIEAITSSLELVKLLVESGADVNVVEKESGVTALLKAVINRELGIANYLIEHGADIKAKTTSNKSIFYWLNYHDIKYSIRLLGYEEKANEQD